MPEKRTLDRARKDKREGKAPTTQAGEFVREEMEHAKEGKHPVKNRKQAIAIGLSKARRAGVDLKPPAKSKTSAATRKKAQRDSEVGHAKKTSAKKSAPKKAAPKKSAAKKTAGKKTATKKTAAKKSR
jgi:hypothetical protein